MSDNNPKRPPDPFGDDDALDIQCRPAMPQDFPQVAIIAVGLLERIFGSTIGEGGSGALEAVQSSLKTRLRHDCTWVMTEGDRIIGVIDLETTETRKLNGPGIPRIVCDALGYTDRVREAGLLPLLVHEPASDEAHQPIVALLPGSRGEGRGTLLLMHGAFWARAQGKNWLTAWLPPDHPFRPVYERRNYFIEQRVPLSGEQAGQEWLFMKKPISSLAFKILRHAQKPEENR